MDYELQTLTRARNAPRFYKQGRALANAGFLPGKRIRAEVVTEKGMVVIKLDTAGTNTVSVKDGDTPVIDINSNKVFGLFEGMDQVRVIVREGEIYIMAIASEVRRKERLERLEAKMLANEPITIGSVSHGAGILSNAIHTGLADAGVRSKLVFANDIEQKYLEQAQSANEIWSSETVALSGPMQEIAFDEYLMRNLPQIDVLEGGIPCTATSVAGRAKKGLSRPEDDPNVGHLVLSFLTMIARCNPAVVILENVPLYAETASMAMFRNQMRDLQYEVHERVLEAKDFGSLENRKRMVAIGVTRGMAFDFDAIVGEMVKETDYAMTVADILDPVPLDDPSWSTMQYLKDKEIRDAEAGKSFARQEVKPEDTKVPTVTRGYMKRRSTDPMLVHPENPDLLRLFTPSEHARIKNVPEHLIEGMSATRAHEVLGQGVCYRPFVAVGRILGQFIKAVIEAKKALEKVQQIQEPFLLAA